MRVIKALLRLVGLNVKVETAGTCVVCGHGACPTLGVPLRTVDGTWKHLICMTVGRQIGAAASAGEEPGRRDLLAPSVAGPSAASTARDRQRPPAVITFRAQLGAGSWN